MSTQEPRRPWNAAPKKTGSIDVRAALDAVRAVGNNGSGRTGHAGRRQGDHQRLCGIMLWRVIRTIGRLASK